MQWAEASSLSTRGSRDAWRYASHCKSEGVGKGRLTFLGYCCCWCCNSTSSALATASLWHRVFESQPWCPVQSLFSPLHPWHIHAGCRAAPALVKAPDGRGNIIPLALLILCSPDTLLGAALPCWLLSLGRDCSGLPMLWQRLLGEQFWWHPLIVAT